MRVSRFWLTLSMVAALPLGTLPLRAQSFQVLDDNLRVASLDGLWRFHTGDDPAWASPNFDDSQWPLLRSTAGWSGQGYKNYSGMAWYRFQILVPADLDHVSVYLPHIYTCFEVFADGKLIGTYGKMPPHSLRYEGGGDYLPFSLPVERHPGGRIAIALRVWHWRGWAAYNSGGPDADGGLVGETKEIERRNELDRLNLRWSILSLQIVGLMETLAGLGALALYLLRRREPEYLWFSLMALFTATVYWLSVSEIMRPWAVDFYDFFKDTAFAGEGLASIAFYRQLLRPKNKMLLRLAVASLALPWLVAFVCDLFGNALGGWLVSTVQTLCWLFLNGWIVFIVASGVRRKSPEARLLLGPVSIIAGHALLGDVGWTTHQLGWQNSFDGLVTITLKPFPIELDFVVSILFLFSVFAILILRFARTRGEEERYAGEFASARNVQQYLIPEHLPPTPGLTIESVYLPAREVGGDFFQVLPDAADGSVLVVVGDVAGKGLQAGMLSALIVGAIRTAAAFTADPGRILALLNERLQGRGLVTCLALRIQHDGAAALVNAGHLPPYRNGEELAMEGSLPLGAILGIEFPVLHFSLASGDKLMLMTDGVAEAQDPEGHLFGFAQIGEMLRSGRTASALAAAAQAFGQEDDITVLTISLVPTEVARA